MQAARGRRWHPLPGGWRRPNRPRDPEPWRRKGCPLEPLLSFLGIRRAGFVGSKGRAFRCQGAKAQKWIFARGRSDRRCRLRGSNPGSADYSWVGDPLVHHKLIEPFSFVSHSTLTGQVRFPLKLHWTSRRKRAFLRHGGHTTSNAVLLTLRALRRRGVALVTDHAV